MGDSLTLVQEIRMIYMELVRERYVGRSVT
jgi:hypothetical protein